MYHNRLQEFDNRAPQTAGGESSRLMELVQPNLEKIGDAIVTAVRRKPLAGIAVGLTIGVALGCLIKRR